MNINMDEVPKQPGCYLFTNKHGHLIYIGKSKCLYNRIKQHMGNTDATDYKHIDMMRELHGIEIITTDTETNALILECQLIKRHKPKYNALLKHDSIYPFIRVDMSQPYPTFSITNEKADDGAVYFGCFYDRYDAQATLALINRIWRTPLCGRERFAKTQRPCLNYHLNKCCAPCGGVADAAAYGQAVSEIVKCLNGNFRFTLSRCKKEMNAASAVMDFEKAAERRDIIDGLEKLKKRQKSLYTDLDNKDVYLFFRAFGESCFALFFIRNGITVNRVDFTDIRQTDASILAEFINENRRGDITLEDGAFLTACLLDIGARKLFIPVSRRMSNEGIMSKLERARKEFGVC